MKAILVLLLVLALCLCGCGKEETVKSTQPDPTAIQSQPSIESQHTDEAHLNETESSGESVENINEYYENGNLRKEYVENPATGEYSIFEYYESGSFKKVISGNRNTGVYHEDEYDENNNIRKSITDDPTTGQYGEWEYFENGDPKKGSYGNHITGVHNIEEFYENGRLKYQKQQMPSQVYEGRFDEDGYCTYEYSQMPTPSAKKGLLRTEECFSDESGKLIKIILNGEVYEDPAFLSQQARLKNFRE